MSLVVDTMTDWNCAVLKEIQKAQGRGDVEWVQFLVRQLI